MNCAPLCIVCMVGLSAALLQPAEAADPEIAVIREHRLKGRYAEALEACKQAPAEADPVQVALEHLAVLREQGEYQQALSIAKSAVEKSPRADNIWGEKARLEFMTGQYEEAEKSVRQALKITGDSLLARLIEANLHSEAGRLKEADDGFRWFVRYYNRKQPKDAESLYLVGLGSAEYARLHSVSSIFDFIVNTLCEDASSNDENFWQVLGLSGELLIEKYNRADGIPELKKALAINPRAADVLASLAVAEAEQYDWDAAAKLARQALEVNPRHLVALGTCIDYALQTGDLHEAEKLIDQALAVQPRSQEILGRKAILLMTTEGMPGLDEWREIVSEGPASNVTTKLADLLRSVLKQNPKPAVFWTVVGERLENLKKLTRAEVCLKQAMELIPRYSRPRSKYGMLLMDLGRVDEARGALDAAFKADPYHVRINNMRKVLTVLKDYETVNTDHFIVRANAAHDKILARYAAEFLEETYGDLVRKFRFEPPQRTHIEIYSDSEDQTGHEWFSARLVGLPWVHTIAASTGMLVAMMSPTTAPEDFNWARILRHEFTHVVTLQQTDFNIPHWYTEALAVQSEGYPHPAEWNALLLDRVPRRHLKDLSNLNQGFTRSRNREDWGFAYCQSVLYAEYLTERFGPDACSKLLFSYVKTPDTEQALRETFHIERAEFEKGYLAYLDRIVVDLKKWTSESSATLEDLEADYKADPKNHDVAAELAYRLSTTKSLRRAEDLAKKVLDEQQRPLATLALANVEWSRDEKSEARDRLKKIAGDKDVPRAVLLRLAEFQIDLGSPIDAVPHLESACAKAPLDVAAWKKLAKAADDCGNEPAHTRALLQLLTLDSDNPAIGKKLAERDVAKKNWKAAVQHARRSMEVDVLDAEVHYLLGLGYRGLENGVKELAELRTAVEIEESNAKYLLELARSEISLGKKNQAKERLNKIDPNAPESFDAKKMLRDLDP